MKKSHFFQLLLFCWGGHSLLPTAVQAKGLFSYLSVATAFILSRTSTAEAEADSFVKTFLNNQNLRFSDIVITNSSSSGQALGVIIKGDGTGPSYVGRYNDSSLQWATDLYIFDTISSNFFNATNSTFFGATTYHPQAITNATRGRYLSGGYILREGVQHPAIAVQEEDSGTLVDFIVLPNLVGWVDDLKYANPGDRLFAEFFMVAATTFYNGKNYGMDMMRFDLDPSDGSTYSLSWRRQTKGNFTAEALAIDNVQNGVFTAAYQSSSTLRKLALIRVSSSNEVLTSRSYHVDQEDPRNLLPLAIVTHPGSGGYTIAGATEDPGRNESDGFLASFKWNSGEEDPLVWAILVQGNRKEMSRDDAFLGIVHAGDGKLIAVGAMQFPDRNQSQNLFLFRQRTNKNETSMPHVLEYKDSHQAYTFSNGRYVIGEAVANSVDGESIYIGGSRLTSLKLRRLDPILGKWKLDCCTHSRVDVEVERVDLASEALNLTYNEDLPSVEHTDLSTIRTIGFYGIENEFSVLWKRNKESKDFWTERPGGALVIAIIVVTGLCCIIGLPCLYAGCCCERPRLCFASNNKWCNRCCDPLYKCLQRSKEGCGLCCKSFGKGIKKKLCCR